MTAPLAEEQGYMRIRGADVPVKTLMIEQRGLKFFAENPRIYSLVRAGGQEPSQEEIYAQLIELEHVRELVQDIKINGGLIDPLIVKDGTFEVLEGNSRLAACRWLFESSNDPLAWAKVKCTLLPFEIDDRLVYALLGQYHVRGKKDWVPFEKAGFLYRRFRQHNDDIPTVAAELGMKQSEAKHLIAVYEFMRDHGEEDRARWSYYDEYIKSKNIKKAREQYPKLDEMIVAKIKGGEIRRAVDIRDDLPIIVSGPVKNLKRFAEGKSAFQDALAVAVDAGGDNVVYKRLYKFRQWLASNEPVEDAAESTKEVRDRIIYELDQIERRAKRLKALISAPSEGGDRSS